MLPHNPHLTRWRSWETAPEPALGRCGFLTAPIPKYTINPEFYYKSKFFSYYARFLRQNVSLTV